MSKGAGFVTLIAFAKRQVLGKALLALSMAVAIAGCLMAPQACAAPDVTIEVAPSGRDHSPAGATRTAVLLGPVRSLDFAISLAREVRQVRPQVRDIAVVLAPGIHRLATPVKLGPQDSGTRQAPFVIEGSPSGDTILRGSVALAPARGLPADISRQFERLGPVARAQIRAYSMPQSLSTARHIDTARPQSLSILLERFSPTTVPSLAFEVFDATGAMVPARWPNAGWGKVVGPAGDGWWSLTLDAPRLDAWRGEPDLWAAGYWKFDYSYERHRVRDVGQRTLTLATPFVLGLKPGARFHVYHALAELDEAGEWYRDHARNLLYAWPRGSAEQVRELEVTVAESAFVSQGASHIHIKNLTIERFFGDGVRVASGRDIRIDNSTIRWTGLHGASFVDAPESGIANSDISDTGEGGVLLSGGDRQKLLPARQFVRACRIMRYARIGYTFKPAVDMHGVGNIVADSYIADAPNFGIQFQGNDHLIEGNEITGVVNDTTDSGAIYTGKDWTAQGTVVRHNYLHDIRGRHDGFETKGVMFDDFASGHTVRGNLFLRVEQPVFIGGGRDNLIEGNVFIASEPAIHIDARGLDWSTKYVVDPASEQRVRMSQVPIASQPWRGRYPNLPDLLADEPGDAKRNVTRGNVMIASDAYRLETLAQASKQTLGPEFGSGWTAPTFKPAKVAAIIKAATAAEAGALVAADLAAGQGPLLAYERMDQAATAGRPGRRPP
jgi:Right handed beta helix region